MGLAWVHRKETQNLFAKTMFKPPVRLLREEEEWRSKYLVCGDGEEDVDGTEAKLGRMHDRSFRRTVNAYRAALDMYQQLLDGEHDSSAQTPEIISGMATVHTHLSEVYRDKHHNNYSRDVPAEDDAPEEHRRSKCHRCHYQDRAADVAPPFTKKKGMKKKGGRWVTSTTCASLSTKTIRWKMCVTETKLIRV